MLFEVHPRVIGVPQSKVSCHGAVAKEAIQGDLGCSIFEECEASRLQFMSCKRWAWRVRSHVGELPPHQVVQVPVQSATAWKQQTSLEIKEEEEAKWCRNSANKSSEEWSGSLIVVQGVHGCLKPEQEHYARSSTGRALGGR